MNPIDQLRENTGLDIYDSSVVSSEGVTYFVCRLSLDKMVGCIGPGPVKGSQVGKVDGQPVTVGPMDHANAEAIRAALPWTAPQCLGLATSAGLGDRLGLATPGHLRAIRGTGIKPILAQQSIREMTRTQRTADEVMDCATFGVLQEGYRDGFGSDADHIQKFEDLNRCVAAGFTMFTIDPGQHVNNAGDTMGAADLAAAFEKLDFATLETSPADLKTRYVGKSFELAGGGQVSFDEAALLRAGVKYGQAVAHTTKMFARLSELCLRPFELEVSVDETDAPTTPAEHYFIANELKRLGVQWVSMAPRFIGRFEKGVDYIGDLDAFRKSFAQHVAVMKTVGPYKMSIHSGSDKFSIYPIVAELAGPYVHLKTAGTSYLEALRAVAKIDPGLFRDILGFAHERYETDKASYHVSADPRKVPGPKDLTDDKLAGVLDLFDGRQLLHVTFGSVLTAANENGSSRFRTRILTALKRDEPTHYDVLARHLGKHLAPFAKK